MLLTYFDLFIPMFLSIYSKQTPHKIKSSVSVSVVVYLHVVQYLHACVRRYKCVTKPHQSSSDEGKVSAQQSFLPLFCLNVGAGKLPPPNPHRKNESPELVATQHFDYGVLKVTGNRLATL